MKVLFLHSALNGASPEYRVHATLASHAPIGSIEPHFVWQGPPFSVPSINADSLHFVDFGRDMSIVPRPNRAMRAAMMGTRLPRSMSRLFSLMRELKPDLIYTSQQQHDVIVARAVSRIFDVPHVVHVHYNVGPWLGSATLRAILKSRNVICVSEYIRQTALLRGVDPKNAHTIVNPVPDADEQFGAVSNDLWSEHGWSDQTPTVLSVGRLDPSKGHIALFEAFAIVVRNLPSCRLVVCGRPSFAGGHEAHLTRVLRDLRLEEHVVMAGQRGDVRALMRRADVFCLPTEMDPCPLVFLEASAEGLPSVAYYSGGVPELVCSGLTGHLSYPGDIAALAGNLLRLLEDRTESRRMGAVARQVAMSSFNPISTAKRWIDVLSRAAAGRY